MSDRRLDGRREKVGSLSGRQIGGRSNVLLRTETH